MKSASTLGRFGAEGGVELIDLRTPGNDPLPPVDIPEI
jgi:hypothetical protein